MFGVMPVSYCWALILIFFPGCFRFEDSIHPLSPTGLCSWLSCLMILLQQVWLPLPNRPSTSPPMSVAARSTGTLQLPPQKAFGQEASLPLAGEEDLAKRGEPDSALEELCKPLFCKLCNVTLNSAQQAQAHYQVRDGRDSRCHQGGHFGGRLVWWYQWGEHFGHHLAPSCLSRYGQLCVENSDELENRAPCSTQWVLPLALRRMCNVLHSFSVKLF